MPGGVGHHRGEDDGAHALGYDIAEKQIQDGDQQSEYEELAEFDAKIEG